jgi:dTDP-4-dehydrorhamnose reductase
MTGDTRAADVIVLGAGGMFGHVAAAALRRQYAVIATARRAMSDCIPYDVDEPDDALAAVVERAKPRALIVNAIATTAAQMAAAATHKRGYQVNAAFPHRLARVAATQNQRVIHISTDAVFPPDSGSVSEDAPVAPRDDYGRSKAAGELTDEHCLTIRCSIVGPPAPRRRSGLWAWVADQPRGATVPGYVNQIWAGMTTQQLAAVCAALVDQDLFAKVRAAGPVHHLAPNTVTSKFNLVCALASLLRPDVTVRPADTPQAINRVLISRYRLLDALTPRWPSWPDTLAAANRH